MHYTTLQNIVAKFNTNGFDATAAAMDYLCHAADAKEFNELDALVTQLQNMVPFIEWAGGGKVVLHSVMIFEGGELDCYDTVAVVHDGRTAALYSGHYVEGEWAGTWFGNAAFEKRRGVTNKARLDARYRSEQALVRWRDAGGDLGRGWDHIKLSAYASETRPKDWR